MKTLYVDVYFLINFCVDFLALHFASRFTKIPTGNIRLIISSALGGIYAVLLAFLPQNGALFSLVSVIFVFVMVFIAAKVAGGTRRTKYLVSFLVFEILIGGLVYYAYVTLDKFFPDSFESTSPNNRRLLLLALIILLCMGVLKLLLSLFGNTAAEKNVTVRLKIFGKTADINSLVDSGNLLRDPMDMSPVMLIKRKFAEECFPKTVRNLMGNGIYYEEVKKRLRLIPVNAGGTTRILKAISPERASVLVDGAEEEIRITLAIDEEGESYGGYAALVPLSALDNILK